MQKEKAANTTVSVLEVDKLMGMTNPKDVHLLYDTGHIYYGGDSPLELAKKHIDRIKHIHLKNVRQPVYEKAIAEGLSFHDAIIEGIFTVPGDLEEGIIDFVPIFNLLAEHDYEGWMIVEAEQDPRKTVPLAYAKMARQYIRDVTGV